MDQTAEPAAWSFPSAVEYRLTSRGQRGTAPFRGQSRGKVRSTVSPRTCNEGLRPLGGRPEARALTLIRRPRPHAQAEGKKEKKNKTNRNMSRPETAQAALADLLNFKNY